MSRSTDHDDEGARSRSSGITRREFVKIGGATVSGTLAGSLLPAIAAAAPAARRRRLSRSPTWRGSSADQGGRADRVHLSRRELPGRARAPARGRDRRRGSRATSIVAYSMLCTHKGCPVAYRPERKLLICPCHWSSFDPAKAGEMVIGQGSQALPQIVLRVQGDVVQAVGVERADLWPRSEHPLSAWPRVPTTSPAEARRRFDTVCQFCIVGCGYHVYKWPVGAQRRPAPDDNALGLDLRKQQPAMGTWISPQHAFRGDGPRRQPPPHRHRPGQLLPVNEGLASVRGAGLAQTLYAPDRATRARLSDPLIDEGAGQRRRAGSRRSSSARASIKAVIDRWGADAVGMKFFDHGGGGGGFENNWAVGRFFFSGIGTRSASIHNRPAYNSEVHAAGDAGVAALTHSYLDAELADTILVVGANPYETQTNYYLAHMVPNLQGATLATKRATFVGETVEAGRMIIVDPRRTMTVSTAEAAGGADRVLHLQIEPGSDIALLNAIARIVLRAALARRGIPARARRVADVRGLPALFARRRPAARANSTSAGRPDHRACRGADPQGRGMDRRAQGRRLAPPHAAALREGPHLGTEELRERRGARRPGAAHGQRRQARHRHQPPGRPPGSLRAPAVSRGPAGAQHRRGDAARRDQVLLGGGLQSGAHDAARRGVRSGAARARRARARGARALRRAADRRARRGDRRGDEGRRHVPRRAGHLSARPPRATRISCCRRRNGAR